MKKYFLSFAILIFLLSIYSVPSFATNLNAPGDCEDGTSHCDASGLSYDSSGCQNSCIDSNTCWNGFKGTCTLSAGPKGYMCDYQYQDPTPPPSCGECGVRTCSGLAGWWCKPDDTKCTGGKKCDATNTCTCPPSKPIWDGVSCKAPVTSCTYCLEDNTPVNTCSTVNIGKKCLDIGGTCQLTPDASCNPECSFKNDPAKDDACPDDCTGGCNLDKNVCNSANTCVKSSSKFCGIDNSCDGAVECYHSTGDCNGGGAGGTFAGYN